MPEAPRCCRAQVPSAGPRLMPAHRHMLCTVNRASSCSILVVHGMPPITAQCVHSVHSAPAAHLQPRILDHMADVSFSNIGDLVSNERLVCSVPDLCAHRQTCASSASAMHGRVAIPARHVHACLLRRRVQVCEAGKRMDIPPTYLHGPESCRHRGHERGPGADAIQNRGAGGCDSAHACVGRLMQGRLLT